MNIHGLKIVMLDRSSRSNAEMIIVSQGIAGSHILDDQEALCILCCQGQQNQLLLTMCLRLSIRMSPRCKGQLYIVHNLLQDPALNGVDIFALEA